MSKKITIHWFRQDLRLHDNLSLYSASEEGDVIPIFILDNVSTQKYQLGRASKWWLYHSLLSLQKSLGDKLNYFIGNPKEILIKLINKYKVTAVNWNRCYEPWQIKRDENLRKILLERGVEVNTYNSTLLWEPWDILKKDDTPYKVFTPFYKNGCLVEGISPRKSLSIPKNLQLIFQQSSDNSVSILNLLPKNNCGEKLEKYWKIGEKNALDKLKSFIESGIKNYKEGRNFPGENFVSTLSPHIHFGEISPNLIWEKISSLHSDENTNHFLSELGWREFSYYLLYHFPHMPEKNLQKKFDKFSWQNNKSYFEAWKKGKTGYPIVDAGMRQLWETGYIHNRVRMIVGSFLVKNLLLHWHYGAEWFWDCLIDADLASNSFGWQWVAGCGTDAAPYFRIFNPIIQGEKFDTDGKYTKRYLPELENLPNKYLFCPWKAPKSILDEAGVMLGINYPYPIVDLKESRNLALKAYQNITKFSISQ